MVRYFQFVILLSLILLTNQLSAHTNGKEVVNTESSEVVGTDINVNLVVDPLFPDYGAGFEGTLKHLETGIFGKDDRKLETSSAYPMSAVGRVVMPDGTHCTGYMITECHYLTNSHCFQGWHKKGNTEIKFEHTWTKLGKGMQRDAAYTSAKLKNMRAGMVAKDINEYMNNKKDWAVVKLDISIGKDLGWFAWRPVDLSTAIGNKKMTFGMTAYHQDKGSKAHTQNNITLRNFSNEGLVRYYADAYHGSSGAGLWRWQDHPKDATKLEAAIVALNSMTAVNVTTHPDGKKTYSNIQLTRRAADRLMTAGIPIKEIAPQIKKAIEELACN